MAVPTKCPDSFEGSVDEFFSRYSVYMLPTKSQMQRAEVAIRDCLEASSRFEVPLIVRVFKQYRRAGAINFFARILAYHSLLVTTNQWFGFG